jgi:hypothetical protein
MRYTPKVGAFVLETLTTGMYTNPLDAIREYIQNASDAIISAERFKTLRPNAGLITVLLDPDAKTLTVRDNGTGISSSDAEARLLNVGMSAKIYGQEAGFRGIGRLAGIAYCKRLEFRTTTSHEDEMTVIAFDCEGIRKSITPSMKEVEELSDVLKKYTTQDLTEIGKEEHFFEVRMEGIDDRLHQFLDMQFMDDYLGQVAPVAYDGQKFLYTTQIQQWLKERKLPISLVKLVLRNLDTEREVFKPYKTHYRTRQKNFDVDVKNVRFYPEDANAQSPFWMWYGVTDLLGMFDDERVAGLRFRRNNIAIGGPDRVAELFPGKEGRLNYWTMGEIHILTDGIIPNARRDGFESTPEWLQVQEALQPFIKEHCKACHDAAISANRPTAKVVSSARAVAEVTKTAMKTGLSSHDEQEQLIRKVERETERVESALQRHQSEPERQQLQSVLTSLQTIRKRLDDKDVFAVSKLKSNLDRRQRAMLKDILALLNSALSEVACTKSNQCLNAVKKAILSKYQVPEDRPASEKHTSRRT